MQDPNVSQIHPDIEPPGLITPELVEQLGVGEYNEIAPIERQIAATGAMSAELHRTREWLADNPKEYAEAMETLKHRVKDLLEAA